jgi:signal transduction histidine kinase
LIIEGKRYALRYAAIYTLLIAIVLFVPLFVYTDLMLEINEAKTKKELREYALRIVAQMEEYDNSGKFHYPRFREVDSGLYDENFKPIFTLLRFEPQEFFKGYHKQGHWRYFILELPPKLYFDASYLVVAKRFDASAIFFMAALIGLGIVALLALFSYILLKNFSAPFERINRALDNFIKDSMHEINTPLSIINVNIDLFTNKFGENRYLKRIKAAAKVLGNIYNDMDYLIKKDRIEYRREPIDLSALVQERIDYFIEIAALRKIDLEARIHPGLFIYSNRTKLQRLIDNTLSNAIKYSKEGAKVRVFLKKTPKNIVLNIRDYGIGIENPKKIFDRFYREDHNKGGFGIGLNIVKNILESENIRLKIVSKPGRGSSFIYFF